jgi:hypothetical protein
MKACQETTVCHEATEADIEKIEPVAKHQEVHREGATVMPVGELTKQRRGRKQAAGRREEPEKLNRGICGSREKLAAACRKVYRRATVAWRKMEHFKKILYAEKLWAFKASDRSRNKGYPPYRSGTAQRNRHRENSHKETWAEKWTQQGYKDPICWGAATPEEKEEMHQEYRRSEQKTAATTGKYEKQS